MAKTTARQFKLFRQACDSFIEFFNLNDWEIVYRHDDSDPNTRAHIAYCLTSKIATIYLTKTWDYEAPDNEVKRCAFHEVCELFLGRLSVIASTRFIGSEDEITEAIHSIIRTLENRVFCQLK